MDNITHSLTGLAAGEWLHRSIPPENSEQSQQTRRNLLLLTFCLASNFPDLDLFLTPLLSEPLGYLLHHRGHTHTFLFLIPQALLLGGILFASWKSARKLILSSATTRLAFLGSLLIGLGLHIGMDFLNSYGVHPFFPIDNHWYYGDSVFIIEPILWTLFGAPFFTSIKQKLVRQLLFLTLIASPLLFYMAGYLLGPISWLMTIVGLTLGWLQSKDRNDGSRAFNIAFASALLFLFTQAGLSSWAKKEVDQSIRAQDQSTARIVDSAMTPFPSNPFCWSYATLYQTKNDDQKAVNEIRSYRLQKGVLSMSPDWLPASQCPRKLWPATDPLPENSSTARLVFIESKIDLTRLILEKENNCHFNAWLRFARIPIIQDDRASDLRFQRVGTRDNFTNLDLIKSKAHPCYSNVPNWSYPRRDLFFPTIPH